MMYFDFLFFSFFFIFFNILFAFVSVIKTIVHLKPNRRTIQQCAVQPPSTPPPLKLHKLKFLFNCYSRIRCGNILSSETKSERKRTKEKSWWNSRREISMFLCSAIQTMKSIYESNTRFGIWGNANINQNQIKLWSDVLFMPSVLDSSEVKTMGMQWCVGIGVRFYLLVRFLLFVCYRWTARRGHSQNRTYR